MRNKPQRPRSCGFASMATQTIPPATFSRRWTHANPPASRHRCSSDPPRFARKSNHRSGSDKRHSTIRRATSFSGGHERVAQRTPRAIVQINDSLRQPLIRRCILVAMISQASSRFGSRSPHRAPPHALHRILEPIQVIDATTINAPRRQAREPDAPQCIIVSGIIRFYIFDFAIHNMHNGGQTPPRSLPYRRSRRLSPVFAVGFLSPSAALGDAGKWQVR